MFSKHIIKSSSLSSNLYSSSRNTKNGYIHSIRNYVDRATNNLIYNHNNNEQNKIMMNYKNNRCSVSNKQQNSMMKPGFGVVNSINNFRYFSSSNSNNRMESINNKASVSVFPDLETATGQILIVDETTKNCAILDSVLNYAAASGKTSTTSVEKILDVVREKGYNVQWILESHIHADHLSAAYYIKQQYPTAKTAIGEGAKTVQKTFKMIYNLEHTFPVDGSQFDVLWKDGDKFQIGNLNVHVLHTPGHTPACVSYYVENDCVFVGDTIFMPDVGTARCDFPDGSASTLFESMKKILALPEETKIYVCHDYPPAGREITFLTTVGEERKNNKHVKDGVTKEEFIEMRTTRDATLKAPNLLLPSIQVNIRAGKLPEPESNGISYMKIPINYLKQ